MGAACPIAFGNFSRRRHSGLCSFLPTPGVAALEMDPLQFSRGNYPRSRDLAKLACRHYFGDWADCGRQSFRQRFQPADAVDVRATLAQAGRLTCINTGNSEDADRDPTVPCPTALSPIPTASSDSHRRIT